MKKYSDLILLAVFWTVMTTTLSARDILAAEYDPRTELTFVEQRAEERVQMLREEGVVKTPQEIRSELVTSRYYNDMHPTIRGWVDQYQDNYYPRGGGSDYWVYRDSQNGVGIVYTRGIKRFNLERTRVFADDAAWTYTKEPAINPKTGKPWITLSTTELRRAVSGTGQKFSDEDKTLIKDILAIVNENFHYFYGAPLVNPSNMNINQEDLVGHFIPTRSLFFGPITKYLAAEGETEQQLALSQKLGRPVYDYDDIIPDRGWALNAAVHCATHAQGMIAYGQGAVRRYIPGNDDTLIYIEYWNQVNPSEISVEMSARRKQLGNIPMSFTQMLNGLEEICREHGVNLENESANRTPLTRALFMVHQKTKVYAEAVYTHEYVQSDLSGTFRPNERRLSDIIPLPKNTSSSSRRKTSTQSESKKKVSTQTRSSKKRVKEDRTR